MQYQIFSAINQIDLIWNLIFPALTILTLSAMAADLIFDGIRKSAVTVRIQNERLNSIPYMTAKELKCLAKQVKLPRYSKMKKYELANSLIEHLC